MGKRKAEYRNQAFYTSVVRIGSEFVRHETSDILVRPYPLTTLGAERILRKHRANPSIVVTRVETALLCD